ncbi:O-antigen ligase family protein [uncultured Mediterranea sp.]|uniref:O-antigen ligase family protein n=1 Tax=uncultured Mediterranea sp. TaxID=1926662 RepID=UPI0027D975F1|nr:O-antigen ligase family protein [uncultured Mediterranea sp.]
MGGTLFFSSVHFVDTQVLPKWIVFAVGGMIWSVVSCAHHLVPFDRCALLPHKCIHYAIVGLTIIEICWGICQLPVLIQHGIPLKGSLDNPAGFSASLCVGFPFILWMLNKGRDRHVIGQVVAWAVIASVLLSASRAGILSLLFVYAIWKRRNLLRSTRAIQRIGLISIFLCIVTALYLIKKDSADGRMLIWHCSLEMMLDKPLFGWGINGFEAHYMDYQAAYFKRHPDSSYVQLADTVQYPYNEYLQIGISFGIVGLLIVIAWLIRLFRVAKKNYSSEKECGMLVWISVCVLGFFSYPLMYPFVWTVLLYATYLLLKDTIKLPSTLRNVGVVCLLPLNFWIGNLIIRRVKSELAWTEAVTASAAQQVDRALEHYQHAYIGLKHDRYFLYNYAFELNQIGLYDSGTKIAKQCRELWADYDLELLLAKMNERRGADMQAELHYRQASLMCPNRFIPLYCLVQILNRNKQQNEAISLARQIVDKPVKIPSFQVEWIKKTMKEYVNKSDN